MSDEIITIIIDVTASVLFAIIWQKYIRPKLV